MTQTYSKNLARLLRSGAAMQANRSNARTIEPEHVLLAVLEKNIGTAFTVISKLEIDVTALQIKLEHAIREFESEPNEVMSGFPMSTRLQEALSLAAKKAQSLRYNYIGTEHLLWAFANERTCPVFAQTLQENGKDSDSIENILKINLADAILKLHPNSKNNEPSILDDFGINLNEKQYRGLLDPVIGREKEMERIIQVLCRRTKNNPVLVGEAGVGKSAIVEGLAAKINTGNVPRILLNKRIISIEVGSLLAGTKYRGQFEERIKKIIDESVEDKNIILFIDEIHTLIGGNAGQNSLDAADLLKPALARGEIQCIGATTSNEYRRYIEKDTALKSRLLNKLLRF